MDREVLNFFDEEEPVWKRFTSKVRVAWRGTACACDPMIRCQIKFWSMFLRRRSFSTADYIRTYDLWSNWRQQYQSVKTCQLVKTACSIFKTQRKLGLHQCNYHNSPRSRGDFFRRSQNTTAVNRSYQQFPLQDQWPGPIAIVSTRSSPIGRNIAAPRREIPSYESRGINGCSYQYFECGGQINAKSLLLKRIRTSFATQDSALALNHVLH